MEPKNSSAAESPATTEGIRYVCTTTIWSVVLNAGDGGAEALERLCKIYWRPVYAFIRWRLRCSPQDAEDLTQAFFARILEKRGLKAADPGKGQFRNFLFEAVTHFLCNQWDKERTIKRGGRYQFISLDAAREDGGRLDEPYDEQSADKKFDRKWALTVEEQARSRLRKQYDEDGKANVFAAMESFLGEPEARRPYRDWAVELGTSEETLQVWFHRLKRRYAELLREEIAQTVRQAEDIDGELRHLMAALSD
jgi:RNA polymerase sigma-70 factor (ECF subfamily)